MFASLLSPSDETCWNYSVDAHTQRWGDGSDYSFPNEDDGAWLCLCCVTDLIRQPGGRITIDFYYFATFFGLFYDYYSTKITLIPTSLSSLCSLIFSSSPQFFFLFFYSFFSLFNYFWSAWTLCMWTLSIYVYGWRNYKIEIISLMEKLVWALAFFPCLQRSVFEDGCVNQSRSDSAQDTRFINEKSFNEKCDRLCVWNCSIRYWENVFTCSSRQPQLKEEVTKIKCVR